MIRHTLASVALLAATGQAAAQTSVTLFGVLDNNLTWGKGSVSSSKAVGTGGLAGSRVGVRGVEDLGDGLRAVFVLEHGLNSDTGAAASPASFWNRQLFVGLGNAWGDAQLGRIYTPTFRVHAAYDAFGPQGVAAQHVLLSSAEATQPAAIRANNAVNVQTAPAALAGFVVHAMTTAAEGAPGKYSGLRLGYAQGGLAGDVALGRYDNPAIGDLKALTLGARWRIGTLTLYGLYDRADSGSSFDTRGVQFSAAYQLGATALKASIAQAKRRSAAGADAGTTRRFGIGAVHDLSKRTAIYTSIAHLSNSDGASTALNGSVTAPNKGSSGIDLGLQHVF